MKRKLALLLAVVMTLALLPTSTLFASSDNRLTGLTGNISDKTVLVESNLLPNYQQGSDDSVLYGGLGGGSGTEIYVYGNLSNSVLKISDNDDVKYVQGAPYLRIEPKSTISAQSTIELSLDGGEWFFADNSNNKWNKGSVDASSMQQLKLNGPGTLGIPGATTLYDLYKLFVEGKISEYFGSASNSISDFDSFRKFGGFSGFDSENYTVTTGAGITVNNIAYDLGLRDIPGVSLSYAAFRSGLTGMITRGAQMSQAPGTNWRNGESATKFRNDGPLQVIGSLYDAFNLSTTYRERLYYSEAGYNGKGISNANATNNWYSVVNPALQAGDQVAGFYGSNYVRLAANQSWSSLSANDNNVIYKMTLSGDKKKAYVTFPNKIELDDLAVTTKGTAGTRGTSGTVTVPGKFMDPFADSLDGGKYIYIPIVARTTTSDGDVTLTVNGNNTAISGGTYVLGGTTSGGTNAYVNDPKTARDEFPIDMLLIKENRAGTMSKGMFEISAPSGYTFDEEAENHLHIVAENFGYGVSADLDDYPGSYEINFKQTRGEPDYSVIQVELKTLDFNRSNTSGIPGTLILKDRDINNDTNHKETYFKLYADDAVGFDTDVNLTIRPISGYGDTNITRQTDVKAGTRKDWTIKFETKGDVPTLINGRYFDDDSALADDETHLAATVLFQENVPNAWWSGRVTQFVLPEGVKIRKAEFHDTENLMEKYETDLEKEDYLNKNKRERYVTVNGSELTMSGIEVLDTTGETRKKAKLELDLWLSIESGYEGDVTLTATGSGVPDELDPIVIAKAISPITLKAEVTPVRIGYQYFEVGNITIQENVAGALEKNKQIWISVTDRIYQDMYFTPGYAVERTEGNVNFKDRGIAGGSTIKVDSAKTTLRGINNAGDLGGGTIVLDIDGASSTASTIVLSNLQLKIDRSVPESTVGYDVYVWGPNIAPNSDVFDYTGMSIPEAYVNNDLHHEMGIHTKYVEVTTPATGVAGASALSAVVKVTAGSGTAYRNGEQITIDPSPFIDSNSRTQVPVRALANLLGVTSEEIIWSNSDRTVTINLKDRVIQFAIGSDIMLVNGAQVRMDTTATIAPENERTFVPFRALGEALGVTVSWDDSTKTATYNADKE